jgi:hypothetical protein
VKNQEKEQFFDDYPNLFDLQITTLRNRGIPKEILDLLKKQKSNVIKNVSKISIKKDNVPFIPVINLTSLNLNNLMTMVYYNENTGHNYLKQENIFDMSETPKEPYYIYDVENGKSTLDNNPIKASEIINKQNRFRLNVAETISLTIHTNVLSKHNVWAAGSYYESNEITPLIMIFNKLKPKPILTWFINELIVLNTGTPSCRKYNI